MRLLLASETYPPDANGAAYFTQRLARGLTEAGNEVHVACPSPSGREVISSSDEAVIHGAPSVRVPTYQNLRFSPLSLGWARKAIELVQPDVVHIQNHFTIGRSISRAACEARIPLVATNHFVPENFTVHIDFLPGPVRSAMSAALWHDLQRIYARAVGVTTPTPFAARLLRDHGMAASVAAISCGIDLDRFCPGPTGRQALARYGVPDRLSFLFVGRLDRDKRIDELILALATVRRELDAQLVIAGRGKELPRLHRAAEDAGVSESVSFTGFVEDVDLPAVYSAADVYVNAGIAELQSISTLEAMACAKPVVAANAMALPHLVRDGVNGYTFEPGDIASLSARLTELLGDPELQARMGEQSLAMAAAHDVAATIRSYEALYSDVLAGVVVRQDRRPGLLPRRGWLPQALWPDPRFLLETFRSGRSPATIGLLGFLLATAVAVVPIDSDFRPGVPWEWVVYVALAPVAALLAVWFIRRAAEDLRAGRPQ